MAIAVFVLAGCLLTGVIAVPQGSGGNRCNQPVNRGECTEALPINRYYYDASTRECKVFAYTGCGGNANNFRTSADCLRACRPRTRRGTYNTTAGVGNDAEIPTTSNCANVNCPNDAYLAAYYKELGCTPEFSDTDRCCPSSYDCSKRRQLLPNKCYHNNHEYSLNQEVPAREQPKCSVHCKCQKSEFDEFPRLRCVSIECAEIFNPRPEPNCKYTYARNKCCATGTVCASPTNSSATAPGTCQFEGKTYLEGERFSSENHICETCYCKRDENGILKTECEQSKCLLQFNNGKYLRRNCVPVFYKEACCPVDYICSSDTVVNPDAPTTPPAPQTASGSSQPLSASAKCKFGAQNYSKGDILPTNFGKSCVTCKCALPPYLTCVKDPENCTN